MRIPFLDINGPRFKQFFSKTFEMLSILFLIALIVIPLIWFIRVIFFTNTFTVQAITIVDARDHTKQAVESLLQDRLQKNIFWLNTASLESKIELSVPQIRDVHIVRKLPSTLKVLVQEKTPVMLLLSQKKYYFVDKDGIAYEEARLETLPGTVLPIVKNNDEAAVLTVGAPVVGQSFLTFIERIQKELPEIVPAQVVEIRIPSLAAREVHFRLTNNWLIRFDVTREASGQLATLRRLLNGTIPAEQQAAIEYIDLRIAQRVYYKIRGIEN